MLLHEWQRPDRPPLPEFQLCGGATLVVDEAGTISTPALNHLVTLAEAQRWRLVLVGDDRQLQAVGRGGLFRELCVSGRVEELEQIHRFTHRWEAAASLLLRAGDPRGLDAYQAHGRIIAGSLGEHLARIATCERVGDQIDYVVTVTATVSTLVRTPGLPRQVSATAHAGSEEVRR